MSQLNVFESIIAKKFFFSFQQKSTAHIDLYLKKLISSNKYFNTTTNPINNKHNDRDNKEERMF